jgi:uncharacterized membrane protein YvbJ
MNQKLCPSCRLQVAESDKFCPSCGKPLSAAAPEASAPADDLQGKVIQSTGNYSGKMTKGKGMNFRKVIFRILIVIILVAIAVLVYWIKTDPKAKEKIINVAGGFVIMGILFWIGYKFRRKGGSNDSTNWDND